MANLSTFPPPMKSLPCPEYKGGEVFRSGLTFYRGLGRIFYFSPGHETFPIYHDPMVQKIIGNGIEWAMRPHGGARKLDNWLRKTPLHR